MSLTAKEKIRLALNWISARHPIMVAAVLADWKIEARDACKTACTNGKNLVYSPKFFEGHTVGFAKAIVLHEAAHCLLGHHHRLRSFFKRNRRIANIGADLAINSHLLPEYREAMGGDTSVLEKLGCFPGVGMFADMPGGKSAEWYIAELFKREASQPQPPQPQPQPQGDEGEGDGGESGDEGDEGEGNEGEGEGDEGEAEGDGFAGDEGEGDEGEGEGNEGEGDGNLPDGLLEKDGSGDGGGESGGEGEGQAGSGMGESGDAGDLSECGVFGECEPAPLSEEGKDATGEGKATKEEREWEERVTNALLQNPKTQGGGVGRLIESLDEAINPRTGTEFEVQWRSMLRQFLTRSARGGYTYTKISRRHGWRTDVILPANRSRNKSKGLMIVDTSGSMSIEEIEMAMREMEKILQAYPGTTIKLITCDTEVTESREFTAADFPLKEHQKWTGRGGTDLDPAFQWAQSYRPDWLVVVSDMGWWFQNALNPNCPVFWLDTCGAYAGQAHPMPFGTYCPLRDPMTGERR